MNGARWIIAVVLLALGTGVAVAGVFGVWAKRQALETGPWVNTSERLLKNGEIRDELGRTLSERVFEIPAVQQNTASLPPDDARKLRRTVREKAPEVLGSKPALRAWRTANRRAHTLFLRFLDGDRDTVTLNVRALLREIAGEAGIPKDLVDEIPRDVTSVDIISKGELEGARTGASDLRTLAIVLPLFALLLFVAAIIVAPRRLVALAATGGCLVLAALTVILLRRIGRGVVVGQLADSSQSKPAVQATWSIATSLLVSLSLVALLVGIVLLVAGAAGAFARRPRSGDWQAPTEVLPGR
jgi:hypothetical protein